jgi:3-hydroxyisobutyrate dehydrogenase-like beta-hydroxyacid dehydrogenase
MEEERPTLAIVSPGAMGSAVGRAWQAAGLRVVATTRGRSARTAELAHGLELLMDLEAVVAAADIVVSVCPPAAAPAVADAIAAAAQRTGRRPLVVDLNAVAPATIRQVEASLARASIPLVDGSISGGPPSGRGKPTRVYLSGAQAARVAALEAPGIALRVVSERVGDASAVKMCTSSVYKGSAALVTQALRTAEANGVTEVVLQDLAGSLGGRAGGPARQLAMAASKADRYPGEMREIAIAQREAGLEAALFEAMAEVFEGIHGTALGGYTPEEAATMHDLGRVLAELKVARSPADTL